MQTSSKTKITPSKDVLALERLLTYTERPELLNPTSIYWAWGPREPVPDTLEFGLRLLAALRETEPVLHLGNGHRVPYPSLVAFEATFSKGEVLERLVQVYRRWSGE